MHLKYKNVNDAFIGIVNGIHTGEIPTEVQPSRNGQVLVVPEPVTVTYTNPLERVLFNKSRDANCFFHLFESLWMLAGRNDVAPLAYYNSKIADYSDDGKTFNGAYGYRWKHHHISGIDVSSKSTSYEGELNQLDGIVHNLNNDSYSRRAVLQMWNVEDDLLKIDASKDICCNTHAYFSVEHGDCNNCGGTGRIRNGNEYDECTVCVGLPHDVPRYLNMTVCNRSNDLIWGMLGANIVHFSFLQEYMAARLGLDVGIYNQFTNNLYCYTEKWEPVKWLAEAKNRTMHDPPVEDCYEKGNPSLVPLVKDPEVFDKECMQFIETDNLADHYDWEEPFLQQVARPVCEAFAFHKIRQHSIALERVEAIRSTDWRIVCRNWITKRKLAWDLP